VVVLLGAGTSVGTAYAADSDASPVASEPAGGATCDPQQPPNGCTQDPGSGSTGASSGDPSPSDSSGDPSPSDSSGDPSPSDSSGEPGTTPPSTGSSTPGDPNTTTPSTSSSSSSRVPGLPGTGGTLARTGGGDAETSLLIGVALLAAGAAVITGVRPRRRH